MKSVSIIYWSGTGNTEMMAELIEKGVREKADVDLKILNVSNASIEDFKDSDIVLLGSPSMGIEVIEEDEMEPYVQSIEALCQGKKLGLFGSYDWGDGQWMRDWAKRMESCGAEVFDGGLIVQNDPSGEAEDACIDYGRRIVE